MDIANTARGKLRRPQSETKSYRKLRNAENMVSHPPQGREHQIVDQYQMFSPENMYNASNIMQVNIYIWPRF